MNNLDREYLERRRQESLTRAEQATDPAIARVHYAFAEGYQRRLEGERIPKLRMVVSR